MRFALTMLPAVPIFLAAPVIPPAPAPPPAPAAAAPSAPATPPAAPRASSSGQAFPFPVKEKTLPNGLKVYVVAFDSPGLVAYYSVVRTGSRNEVEPGKSGFAHFFEHLMFRGSENYTAEKYNAVIKEMGADSNAFTSDDLTVYHILASNTALPKIVEIEADRFQHLQYEEAKFQKEARAVLGEYNKNASNPIEKMVEVLYDNAFAVHTYKHTTMGFLKDIENMPKELMYSRQFFERYYRPENVILLVVGDADPEKVFRLVEKSYGEWQPGNKHPAVPVEPPQKKEKRAALSWKGATLPLLLEGYHTPAFSTVNVNVPTLDVLSELLFAERAPLYKRLVIKEQKVETLVGSNDPHVDPNLFTVLARIKKPADVEYVEKAIHEEMARIAREGVDEKTLAEVLSHVKYAFAGQLSTADRTATTAASFLALTGDLESINTYFALFDKVTSADVKRVAAAIFTPVNRTVVTMKAEK
jgi:zinc protease